MTRPRQSGFTLVELLVALAILGATLAGLTQGLRIGAAAWERQTARSEWQDDIRIAERLLRRLVEQADPGPPSGTTSFRGFPGALQLRTVLRQGGAAVDTAVGVDEAGRLVLRMRDPDADGAPIQELVLLAGVERLAFAFLPGRDGEAPSGWVRSWAGRSLPRLVRIRIVFADARRQWPDMLMRPALDRLE